MQQLDKLSVLALMNNDQPTLALCREVLDIAVGKRCPHCGNTDADTIQVECTAGQEALCEACEAMYDIREAVQSRYDDAVVSYEFRHTRTKARR